MECKDNVESAFSRKVVSPGLQVLTFPRSSYEEYQINVVPEPGEPPEAVFQKAAEVIREKGCVVITQEVFGIKTEDGTAQKALEEAFGDVQWPVTWLVDGEDPDMSGTQLWAITGVEVKPIEVDSRIVGNFFEDEHARYCRLGDIRPSDTSGTREEQARAVFEMMLAGLEQVGMDFSNVIRTWFYNDDILDWYGAFNKVRDDFFTEKGVFGKLVPASTGIGGTNPFGAALVSELIAVEAKDEAVKICAVPSPLQCPALDYGSSFSRAVELDDGELRRVYVSGTASIEPGGKTMYLDDMDNQIDLTMKVVHAILELRGMTWSDVTRGVAYILNAEDGPAYTRYCTANNLPSMPVVVTNNVVCRDDLLFEIEVEAVRKA